MIKLLPGIESSASALQAERIRMEVIAQNIANANATKTADGTPYQRQLVKFESVLLDKLGANATTGPHAITAARIVPDTRPGERIYQPSHPDADSDGLVLYPNVKIHEEMADMIAATRAYEANLAVIKNARAMTLQTLAIGRQ